MDEIAKLRAELVKKTQKICCQKAEIAQISADNAELEKDNRDLRSSRAAIQAQLTRQPNGDPVRRERVIQELSGYACLENRG